MAHRLSDGDGVSTPSPKAGFQQEGVTGETLYWDGTFHDAVVMSVPRLNRATTWR